MEETRNLVLLTGCPAGRPAFSHMGRDGRWFTFPLRVERLSGTFDEVNVLVTEELMTATAVGEGARLGIRGELRSFNNKSGTGRRLIISVMAREMKFTDAPDENDVLLVGTLCRRPSLRTTPMGRQICDMMLAVGRRYGRSDYLPVIAWGGLARKTAEWDTGTNLIVQGRIQSRKYIKNIDGTGEERTAYEVSASHARECEPPALLRLDEAE